MYSGTEEEGTMKITFILAKTLMSGCDSPHLFAWGRLKHLTIKPRELLECFFVLLWTVFVLLD